MILLWLVATADVVSLFPKQASVFTPRPGLTRLILPVEVLESCAADLSDLRLFAGGHQLPYIVDTAKVSRHDVELAPLDVRAAKREELPATLDKARRFREKYEVGITGAPSGRAFPSTLPLPLSS